MCIRDSTAVVQLTAAVIVAAAAQQDQNPQPGIVIATAAVAVVVIAAQAQQQNYPNETVITATTKSTHNKNTSLSKLYRLTISSYEVFFAFLPVYLKFFIGEAADRKPECPQ